MVGAVVVLVRSYTDELETDAVTPERIEETAGATPQPFTSAQVCEVYVVPLDGPSETDAGPLASSLANGPGCRRARRAPSGWVRACSTANAVSSPRAE